MNTDYKGKFGVFHCAHPSNGGAGWRWVAVIRSVVFPGSIRVNPCPSVVSTECFRLRAGLKMVASAILADVEPGLPARRNGVAAKKTTGPFGRFTQPAFFPGGKMPPSTAGRMPAATFSDRL